MSPTAGERRGIGGGARKGHRAMTLGGTRPQKDTRSKHNPELGPKVVTLTEPWSLDSPEGFDPTQTGDVTSPEPFPGSQIHSWPWPLDLALPLISDFHA